MKVACWNTEWHRATSPKGAEIQRRLLATDPEIICCPEAHEDFLTKGWHGVFSTCDTGYPIKRGRRKVTLWSRHRWEEVDDIGSPDLPSGRFICATTMTSLGPVRVVGVCVPWSAAHVSSGRRDRKRWEDHLLYLRALRTISKVYERHMPTILVGDFNQCIPRRTAPRQAYDELLSTLGRFIIWTDGDIPNLEGHPVCHIGGSDHFHAARVTGMPRLFEGKELSDHDGLAADLVRR